MRTSNGTLGSKTTRPSSFGAPIAGMPNAPGSASSAGGAAAISAATSSAGTAYVGTTRLGSHTSIALVLSITVSSPITARIRLSVGS